MFSYDVEKAVDDVDKKGKEKKLKKDSVETKVSSDLSEKGVCLLF